MWRREAIYLLIELYKQNTHLYDAHNKSYFNRELREITLTNMCNQLKDLKPNVNVQEIKNKIRVLRTQFIAELKLRNFHVSNAAVGEHPTYTYEPKLWCFDKLQFLENFIKVKKSSSEYDENDCGQHEDEEQSTTPKASSIPGQTPNSNSNFQLVQIKLDPLDLETNQSDVRSSCETPSPPMTPPTTNHYKIIGLQKKRKRSMDNDSVDECANTEKCAAHCNSMSAEKRRHEAFANFIAEELAYIKDEEILVETKWNIQTCLHNGIKAQRQKLNFS